MKTAICALLMVTVVAGCSSDIGPYSISAENIVVARGYAKESEQRIGSVRSSSANPQNWISCRGIAVGMPDDQPFHTYIAKALQDELALGDLMAPDGAITLDIYLKELGFSSWEGTWRIVTDVSANDAYLFEAVGSHDHDAAFTADAECQNAATNFEHAVQDLTKNIMTHPQFEALFTP